MSKKMEGGWRAGLRKPPEKPHAEPRSSGEMKDGWRAGVRKPPEKTSRGAAEQRRKFAK